MGITLALVIEATDGQIMRWIEPQLLQEIVRQYAGLHQPPTPEGYPLAFEILDRGNTRTNVGDKMRREVNINVPHCHHLTGILEATLYLYIGKRSIPRQIDLVSDECLNQRIVVRVEHPAELDAMATKMRLESSEYTDVSRQRRPTKPHHNDLLLL
jgi:predicted DNA-binding transcriptional regulator AlpA